MTKKISEYYDLLSGIYDAKTPEFGRIPCVRAVDMLNTNNISELGKILELGCGTGQMLDELGKTSIHYGSYVGVDISPKMIETIQAKYPHILTKRTDIEENFDIEGKFDNVIMIGVFEFIKNKAFLLDEIYKRLNVGGHLIMSFEKFVEGHPLQSEKVSPMGKNGDAPIHPLTDFDNFRHTWDEIREILGDKFEILAVDDFVGYYKTQDRIPINYGLILAKKI